MLSGNDLRTKADPDRVRHGVEDGIVNIAEVLSWCKELQIETVTLGLLAADQLAQANGDLNHRLNDLVRVVEDLSNSPTKPRLSVHGRLDMLPDPILSQVNEAVARTANNTGLKANLVICYDGRSEIVHAVRELLAEHARQGRSIDDIPDGSGNQRYQQNALRARRAGSGSDHSSLERSIPQRIFVVASRPVGVLVLQRKRCPI